jgi:thiol:disulfide interchange protein DsbD
VLASFGVRWLATFLLVVGFTLAGARGAAAAEPTVALRIAAASPELARGASTGVAVWADIGEGWHINSNAPDATFLVPTRLEVEAPAGVRIDPVAYPAARRRSFTFTHGQGLLVYEGKVSFTTVVTVPGDFVGATARIAAVLRYQACSEATCLPPATAKAEVLLPVSASAVLHGQLAGRVAPVAGEEDVGRWIAEHGLPVTLLLVMLLGLGLNLTPCVYPLISVTVAFFGRQGRHRPYRVAALAVAYVLGITVSFSAVGMAAAMSGGLFGAALQKPLVLAFIAAVLVVLALGSFGLYQLQPPPWLMQRVGASSAHGVAGALFMGLTMGIVAAPCVGPVVLGLLLFVGSQQSLVLGFQLFFALGLGLGLPYLALALAAGSLKALPRSGDWLVWVERAFGFLLLGLAAYFVRPLLPPQVGALIVPAVLFVAGIYLGFIDRSGHRWPRFRTLQRLAGGAAILAAVWTASPPAAEGTINWVRFDDAELHAARESGRPAVVDVIADWCLPCHEMDRTTFADTLVQEEANRFAMLRLDLTHDSPEASALTARYQIQGVPTILFFDGTGAEVRRLVGYVSASEMLAAMGAVR